MQNSGKFELIEKWIEALRSGKYNKCNYYLCHDLGDECFHCALGVFYEENLKREIPNMLNMTVFTYADSDKATKQQLKKAMASIGTDQEQIAALNDIKNYSFNQIADFLQSKLDAARALERP